MRAVRGALRTTLHLGVGVGVLSPAGVIIGCNPALTELLACRPGQLNGRRFSDFLDAVGRGIHEEQMRNLAEGRGLAYRLSLFGNDGLRMSTWVHAACVRDGGGAFLGAVVTIVPGSRALSACGSAAGRIANTVAALISRDAMRSSRPPGASYRCSLSDRECEVVLGLRAGAPPHCIAQELCISPRTLRVHVRAARRKLGTSGSDVTECALCDICGRSDCNRDERVLRWLSFSTRK